jgi:hypothetical protein
MFPFSDAAYWHASGATARPLFPLVFRACAAFSHTLAESNLEKTWLDKRFEKKGQGTMPRQSMASTMIWPRAIVHLGIGTRVETALLLATSLALQPPAGIAALGWPSVFLTCHVFA